MFATAVKQVCSKMPVRDALTTDDKDEVIWPLANQKVQYLITKSQKYATHIIIWIHKYVKL